MLTMIGQSRLEARFELSRCGGKASGEILAAQLEVKGDGMAGLCGLRGL
jgi:hypothetical protein